MDWNKWLRGLPESITQLCNCPVCVSERQRKLQFDLERKYSRKAQQ